MTAWRAARWLAAALLLGTQAAAQSRPPGSAAEGEPASRTPLAVLGDRVLTRDEVEGAVAFRIYRLEVDIHSLLKAETERRADEILLAREAERRGTTPEALLAKVESGAAVVSDAEVDAYLAEHPADAAARAGDLRARVRHYLSETRRIQRRLDLVAELRRAAGYRFLLEPPTPPRTDVDVGGAPARGPEDAPVTIVHFAAFGSEPSARSAAAIARVAAEFPGRVRQVHRNLLREGDERGLLAARLGFRAQDRGLFWQLHDRWFAQAGRLPEAEVVALAREVGLGDADLAAARSDLDLLRRVKHDFDAAGAVGVPREPSLFVNGRYLSGLQPYPELRAMVAQEVCLGDRRRVAGKALTSRPATCFKELGCARGPRAATRPLGSAQTSSKGEAHERSSLGRGHRGRGPALDSLGCVGQGSAARPEASLERR